MMAGTARGLGATAEGAPTYHFTRSRRWEVYCKYSARRRGTHGAGKRADRVVAVAGDVGHRLFTDNDCETPRINGIQPGYSGTKAIAQQRILGFNGNRPDQPFGNPLVAGSRPARPTSEPVEKRDDARRPIAPTKAPVISRSVDRLLGPAPGLRGIVAVDFPLLECRRLRLA
jgi:hypothetical protein